MLVSIILCLIGIALGIYALRGKDMSLRVMATLFSIFFIFMARVRIDKEYAENRLKIKKDYCNSLTHEVDSLKAVRDSLLRLK